MISMSDVSGLIASKRAAVRKVGLFVFQLSIFGPQIPWDSEPSRSMLSYMAVNVQVFVSPGSSLQVSNMGLVGKAKG